MFVLFLLILSAAAYAQNEQISTWPLANRIGLKGFQAGLYFARPGQPDILKNLEKLIPAADPGQEEQIRRILSGTSKLGREGGTQMDLCLVFVPFRKSKKAWIRRLEWQTGLATQSWVWRGFFQNEQYSGSSPEEYYSAYAELEHSAIFWSNWLLGELPVNHRFKFFIGPGAQLSIMSSGSAAVKSWDKPVGFPPVNNEYEILWKTFRRTIQTGLQAGTRINFSCRLTGLISYELNYSLISRGIPTMGFWNHGLNMALRYKFQKPDEEERQEKENAPFW